MREEEDYNAMSSLLGNLQMLQAKVIARVPSYYSIKGLGDACQ